MIIQNVILIDYKCIKEQKTSLLGQRVTDLKKYV